MRISKTEEERKELRRISQKRYREKNKEKIKLKNRNYRLSTNYNKNYYSANKEKIIQKRKKYYILNKKKILARDRIYCKNNREKINNRIKLKENTSEIFKLKKNTRALIRNSFSFIKSVKNSKTEQILGCTYNQFKKYIEDKFKSWMNWGNRGLYNGKLNYGWDLDHIIPISTAKTIEDVIALNHHTNFQPLCSKINRDIKRNFY